MPEPPAEETAPVRLPADARAMWWSWRWMTLLGFGVLALALLVWYFWDALSTGLDLTRDLAQFLREGLAPLGPLGPILVVLVVVAQVVVPPIPGPLVALTIGAIYGPLWGFVLVWIGSMLGYALAFQISRRFGRKRVAALEANNPRVARLGAFMDRRGAEAVFLLRLTPLSISFDVLAYLAGLTRVRFPDFMLAAGLGMVPGLFVLILAGDTLGSDRNSLWILFDWRFLLVVAAVATAFFVGLTFYRRHLDREELRAAAATPAEEAPGERGNP